MNICRFNGGRIGVVLGDVVADITDRLPVTGHDEPALRIAGLTVARRQALVDAAPRIAATGLAFSSPVLRPGKVVAAPVNYRAHIDEMLASGQSHGHTITDIRQAGLFLKASSSVVGPSEGIAQRFLERRTDHEIELCAVIGRPAANVGASEALRYVAGYCLGLDITVRGPEDRSFRKSIDTYCVLGPWLVTSDAMPDPDAVDLTLTLNGTVRQQANTSDMVLGVAELIAFASRFYTLHPGDVLMTGTPAGVGPIRPGDVLLAQGSGLGSMSVRVRAADASAA